MTEKKWCVYCHTNRINGKKYIGITSNEPSRRWGKNGRLYGTTCVFGRAINKYGWDNFEHKILYSNLSTSDACWKEHYLIKLLNCRFPNGYNYLSGGDCKLGYIKKDLDRFNNKYEKSNVAKRGVMQFDLDGNFIKEYESVLSSVRDTNIYAIRDCCMENNKTAGGYLFIYKSMYNENYLKERLEKANTNQSKAVLQINPETYEIVDSFQSIVEAEIKTGCPSISECINGVCNKSAGYIWILEKDSDKIIEIVDNFNNKPKRIANNRVAVLQYNKDGVFIKRYDSMAIAEKETDAKEISMCCNFSPMTTGGFIWFREHEYSDEELNRRLNIIKKSRTNMLKENIKRKPKEKGSTKPRKTLQIDPITNKIVKVWDSANKARVEFNCKNISHYSSNNTIKECLGYLWMYEENYKKYLEGLGI